MNLPLIEKFRPKDFDEVIGVSDIETFKTIISDPMSMPNMLFYGPQGTGKTTCAKIIVEKLKPIDFIRINGSDTVGVDTIREKVYNFVTAMSSTKEKPKLVWIEEFDFMSQNAFAALRAMIEQYMSNARFLCTCNYINKIPEPIQSRFSVFEFKKPDKFELRTRLKFIAEQEGITVSDTILEMIADITKGDIRSAINNMQKLSSNPEKRITMVELQELELVAQEVYKLINAKNWSKIRYSIPNKHPDYNKLLVELEDMYFKSDLPVDKKAKVTETISTGLYEMAFSFDKNICFSAVASRIMKVI